jgi:site-specific DNA recombinase
MFVNDNMSLSKIAKTLNERRIPTKRNGKCWDTSSVKLLLSNSNYIGKVRYKGIGKDKYIEVDGHHKRIIDDELFNLAQGKIENIPKYLRTKKPKENNYFCGALVCGECGSKYTTHNYTCKSDKDGEKVYRVSYRCNQKSYYKGNMSCKSSAINHGKMERAFVEYIKNIGNIKEDKNINIDETKQQAEQELLKNIVDCEKKINNLQNRRKQAIEQYMQGIIEIVDYKSMIDVFNENYKILENEIQRYKTQLSNENKTPEVLPEDIILDIKQNWEKLNNNERMIFLQRFVKKIIITVEKERANSSIAKVNNIEFHSGEIPKREKVRSQLR